MLWGDPGQVPADGTLSHLPSPCRAAEKLPADLQGGPALVLGAARTTGPSQHLLGSRHPQMRTAVILPQQKVRGQCYALHRPTTHTTNTAHQHPGSGMGKPSHTLPLMPQNHQLFPQSQQSCVGHRDTQGTCARLSPPQLYMHTSCTAAPDHPTQQGDSGRASSATEAKNPVSASQKLWLHPHEQPRLSTDTDGNI